MRKYFYVLILMVFSLSSMAQVTIWKDTVSVYNVPKTNTDVFLYDTIFNNTLSAITITWNKSADDLLPGWSSTGICDEEVGNGINGTCYQYNAASHSITIPANAKATIHTIVKASPTADDGITWIEVTTNYGKMVFQYINWATIVQDINNNNIVSVYPNPANGFIHINTIDSKVSNVNLLNITGTRVAHFDLKANTSMQIPMTNLPQGIYLLQITDNTGKQLAVKRVCKQ